MKYVALLSGGKDSCFNLLHCEKSGHELVAAASLGPEAGKEELDSYLYQTVGQDAIEFVAQALDVPLYRRVITGTAIQQGSEYGGRNSKDPKSHAGDETEDLFVLLSEVKDKHPDILGVSVGAILSNYQRVRVEHVCRRLGLTPLCYLWNRDQIELLNEMIEAGMEAILIKVAGIGLTTKHLGKTLGQMQPTLLKLNSLYGAHVCGEGGEYESLTLDCPLFKRRIVLTETETVIHSDNDFATVAFLRVKSATLEDKATRSDSPVHAPDLLQDKFKAIESSFSGIADRTVQGEQSPRSVCNPLAELGIQSKKSNSWVSVANVQRTSSGHISLEDEVKECFHLLEDRLAQYSLDLSNCSNINIFLSSIDLFGPVNAVYGTFFGSGPPARACVAVDLPDHIRVRLDCIAYDESSSQQRTSLHVQGLSYWAPANIGPYSQAITAAQNMFVSGQIGLIPAELSLPLPRSLGTETALALQHVHRVVDVLRRTSSPSWEGHELLALYWFADRAHLRQVKEASKGWPEIKTPTLFLSVKTLPKEALMEKQVQLHTGLVQVLDEDDTEPELRQVQPDFVKRKWADSITAEGISIPETNEKSLVVCGKGREALDLLPTVIPDCGIVPFSARLFHRISTSIALDVIPQKAFGKEAPTITPIPCRQIATICKDDWDFALCMLQM